MVTAANGAIVSRPAMISPAVEALNRGSPPQARAAPGGGEAGGAVVGSADGAAGGAAVGCGTMIDGCGRTTAAAVGAGRPPAGDGEPGGSPTAASVMAPQQAAIAAANVSRLPRMGRLSARGGRAASSPGGSGDRGGGVSRVDIYRRARDRARACDREPGG